MGCYIWYSEEGTGRGPSSPRPLLAVPNVTAHPSTASVPITILLYNGPLICGFNVPFKGLTASASEVDYRSVCQQSWSQGILLCKTHHFFPSSSQSHSQYSFLPTHRGTSPYIIGVLLGMAYGRTRQSWPSGLYKSCPLLEWNGTHGGMAQAQLTWVPGSVPRWFTRPKTVTHPGSNRA